MSSEQRPPEAGGATPAGPPARTEGPSGLPEAAAMLGPLRELVEAFRENSESIKTLAEGQVRIAKRLERTDRSEAVVQSTQALNETFRGVQRTQERLLTRLDRGGRRPWAFLIAAVLAFGGLIGGLTWYLLGWLSKQQDREGAEGVEVLSRELARRDEKVEELQGEMLSRTEELLRQANLTEEQRRTVEDLRARVAELEERDRESGKNRAALSEALRENARLMTEGEAAARRAAEVAGEAEQERGRREALERRVADLTRQVEDLTRAGRAGGPAAAPAGDPPGTAAAPAPPAMPAGAERDSPGLSRLADVLNGLLAGREGGESWGVERIGGARGKVLYDVVFVNSDREGREMKRIHAGEARIVVEAARRRVELRLRSGHIVYYGVKAPFPGDPYVVTLANVDPSAWLRSGLTVLEEK